MIYESLPQIVKDFIDKNETFYYKGLATEKKKMPNHWSKEKDYVESYCEKLNQNEKLELLKGLIKLEKHCLTYPLQKEIELKAGFNESELSLENEQLRNQLEIERAENFIRWAESVVSIIEEQKESSIPPEGKKKTANPKNKKLDWNAPINVLGDILYQLKREMKNPETMKPLLEGDNDLIAEMISSYFSNIDSKATIIDCLNPNKRERGTTTPKKFQVKISIEEIKKYTS